MCKKVNTIVTWLCFPMFVKSLLEPVQHFPLQSMLELASSNHEMDHLLNDFFGVPEGGKCVLHDS